MEVGRFTAEFLGPATSPPDGGFEGVADSYANAFGRIISYVNRVRSEDGVPNDTSIIDALVIWPTDEPLPY